MNMLLALLPLTVLTFGALALMMAEAFSKGSKGLALGAAACCGAGLAASVAMWARGPESFEGISAVAPWIIMDKMTLFFSVIMCMGGLLASLLAGGYMPEHRLERGEFYALILFSTVGAIMLAGAGDLLTVFLGLETMSIGVYAMAAFRRGSPRSAEGALKYFLLGSFAAAILLYGFALLYGATGHTELAEIGAAVKKGDHPGMVVAALVLVVVGLAFKISAVPFHMWTPDAYEGAPTPATTYMAAVVKTGAFAMMLRVLLTCFGDAGSMSWAGGWPPVLAWMAVITMTVANVIAGRQESVKRMLAYSSVAHAGYLLVAIVATMRNREEASASLLFYLLVYTVSTVGAFGSLILCGHRDAEAVSFEDLAGVGRRHPAAALAFSVFLLSLAGIPPTAGFFAKWFVFRVAMEQGLYWLTIAAFMNSVIGVYYYLRVMVYMYMREPAPGAPFATPMRSGYVNAALILSAIAVVVLGLSPSFSLDMAVEAAKSLTAPAGG